MRDPLAVRDSVREIVSDWEELRIKAAVGTKLARRSRIVIRRPWWMPARTHRWVLGMVFAEADESDQGA